MLWTSFTWLWWLSSSCSCILGSLSWRLDLWGTFKKNSCSLYFNDNSSFCVRRRAQNTVNILCKNLVELVLTAVTYWMLGWSLGQWGNNPFIGGFDIEGEVGWQRCWTFIKTSPNSTAVLRKITICWWCLRCCFAWRQSQLSPGPSWRGATLSLRLASSQSSYRVRVSNLYGHWSLLGNEWRMHFAMICVNKYIVLWFLSGRPASLMKSVFFIWPGLPDFRLRHGKIRKYFGIEKWAMGIKDIKQNFNMTCLQPCMWHPCYRKYSSHARKYSTAIRGILFCHL